jgi:hypothetical protein
VRKQISRFTVTACKPRSYNTMLQKILRCDSSGSASAQLMHGNRVMLAISQQ